MNSKIVFFSAIDIWSMKEGIGAPSFYNTLKLYLNKGHEVVLIKPKGNEFKIDGLNVINFTDHFIELKKIKKVSFFARIISALEMTVNYLKLAAPMISKEENVLIYAYEVETVMAAKILSKVFGVPYVSRFQGTVLDGMNNTLINRLKKYPHFYALSQKSNLLIMTNDGTNGDKVLDYLKNPSKQFFWRNGVDLPRINNDELISRSELGINDDDFLLMTLSRVTGWKRIDRAIDALAILSSRYPKIKLMVVGEGDALDSLKEQANNLGVLDKVFFTGGIKQTDSYKYFNVSDVFLSLYDLSNLGNPLFEALTNGMPIVTLDIGATNTVITDRVNGLLLSDKSPDNIAVNIEKLYVDKDFREMISKGAKEYAEKNLWTWEERMETEYVEVSHMVDEFYGGK